MSQENVEIHRRGLDAFNERDLDSFLALADPEVEFRSRLLAVEGGSYHGLEGARHWWESLLAAFPDFQIEALEIRGAGDYTIAKLHNRGHGGGSDAPFEEVLWQVGKWRDGKIVSWQMHGSEAEALEAAGLSE
jgi:ketosteroid isomerase-like protein